MSMIKAAAVAIAAILLAALGCLAWLSSPITGVAIRTETQPAVANFQYKVDEQQLGRVEKALMKYAQEKKIPILSRPLEMKDGRRSMNLEIGSESSVLIVVWNLMDKDRLEVLVVSSQAEAVWKPVITEIKERLDAAISSQS